MNHTLARAAVAALALALAVPARADTSNFELSGKIYTKYMYKNDNSQGCLSLSNPFWVDNIGGNNGACTEFELNIKARVSSRVSAGVRLQSRWGMLWQDWWENGDLKPGVIDTSGESLGMNHATYIKLRGAFVRFAPPIPSVRWVTIGSTDYSMWNEWTIGKARYIDRDNGDGVFIEGDVLSKKLAYTVGAMAAPKLWAGPGWNTGLPANESLASLYGTDWAFAAKLDSRVTESLRIRVVGSWLQDWEADKYDPWLTGAPEASRDADHNVALDSRFRGMNATLDATYTPANHDWVTVSGMIAGSTNKPNPDYATNLVQQGQGFSPVVFKQENGRVVASNGLAGTLRLELFDPFQNGLSARFEYFNIGSEYNAVMGARREADVLLTDGFISGGFTRGGQLPTLNIANEFVDWDEPWYESIIGWNGGTGILEFVKGPLKANAEYTYVGFNTNMQDRDVEHQYPDFLYTHGFTDTEAFTADGDYANVYDRGRDPRSVYTQWQDRRSHIAVLNVSSALPSPDHVGDRLRSTRVRVIAPVAHFTAPVIGAILRPFRNPVLTFKAKYINDRDNRMISNPADDYLGLEYLGMVALSFQPTNELKTSLGYEFTYWDEAKRNGTEESGFYDTKTRRHMARAGLSYAFGGALLSYSLEYFHKYLDRDEAAYFDMKWNVWRSKATFEVAW